MEGISIDFSSGLTTSSVMTQSMQNVKAQFQVAAVQKVMEVQSDVMSKMLRDMGKGQNVDALA